MSDVLTSGDLSKDQMGSEDEMIPLVPVGERMFKDVEHAAMVNFFYIKFLLHFSCHCFANLVMISAWVLKGGASLDRDTTENMSVMVREPYFL